MGASGGGHQPWGQGSRSSWFRLLVLSGRSWPCRWPRVPHQHREGGGGAVGPAADVGAVRKAGCWETSLLSSDKNSSGFKVRGRAALLWGYGGRDGLVWPPGLCLGPSAPWQVMVQGDGGGWAWGVPWYCLFHPQIWLRNVRKGVRAEWGRNRGCLCPPTLLPLPLWLISLGLSPEGRGTGQGEAELV